MALDINQAKKAIAERKKSPAISKAIEHQNRVKFHAQTALSQMVLASYPSFFAFVKNLIPPEKYKIFQELFRYPVKTNEVTGICFDKLSRIFDGRNPVFDYQFMNPESRDDWEYYRKDVLHEPKVWEEKGWEFFKTEINSILVVDLPREQASDKPEPYFYWLTIDRVITFEADYKGRMDFLAFYQYEGKDRNIVLIDDASYRVFREENGTIGELLVESPHDLGYCPARFFWDEPISLQDPDVKKSPLTDELTDLDWYLFFETSKRHLDLYGSYPILSGYERNCNYIDEHDNTCDHGFLKDKEGVYLHDMAGALIPCPKCGSKRVVGPGTFVEIPMPNEDDSTDLRNPVQMLTVDRNSLDYNVAEVERLKKEIITSVVGSSDDITGKQALNEKQVQANFESQSQILKGVKKSFESAMQFVDETICRLRYGDVFVSAEINLGTEFYIYSVTELRERYKIAKEAGASEAELDALQNQIIETEYRNNPNQRQRMLVLADLEPYRHLTRNEALILYDKGLIDETELRIKLNFANFVRRFERENTNIVEFGDAIPYARKIEIINEKFKDYAGTIGNGGNSRRIDFPGNED